MTTGQLAVSELRPAEHPRVVKEFRRLSDWTRQ